MKRTTYLWLYVITITWVIPTAIAMLVAVFLIPMSWWILVPVGTAVLALILFWLFSTTDGGFGTIKTGEMKFIVRGETLVQTILNMKDWHLEDAGNPRSMFKQRATDEEDNNPQPLLWGIYVWMFPFEQLHAYRFNHGQGLAAGQTCDYKVGETTLHVDRARFEELYEVTVPEVEFDGVPVNLSFTITVRMMNPYQAIFVLTGKWLPGVVSALESALSTYAGEAGTGDSGLVSLEDLQKTSKEPSPVKADGSLKSPKKHKFMNMLLAAGGDTVVKYGVKIVSIEFKGMEPALSQEVKDAMEARQIAERKGDALVSAAAKDALAAVSEKEAEVTRGEGRAQAMKASMEVANEYHGGMTVLNTHELGNALGKSDQKTLVLGQGVMPTIPLDNRDNGEDS